MRKRGTPQAANSAHAPGDTAGSGTIVPLDRRALARAGMALAQLERRLPQASVAILAREVIARMARQGRPGPEQADGAGAMADALVASDDAAAMRLTMRLLAAGLSVEQVYLTHLAGAARDLGARWDANDLGSAQVTIAAARIYAIMRGLAARMSPETWPDGRHAVFATVPGEHHTLGVSMAADLFRREGWLIDLKAGRSHDELMEELGWTEFGILALTATTGKVLPDLTRLIAAVRVTAPHARILVAGRLAQLEPGLALMTDADAAAGDIEQARAVLDGFAAAMRGGLPGAECEGG